MSERLDVVAQVAALRSRVRDWKRSGRRVGFVPTMGALHEGHLALVRHAGEIADRVVASVFVNPTQFGPDEDFDRYPRQPERDAELLAEAGCRLLFLPAVDTIYPPGNVTFVALDDETGGPAHGLEGSFRPGHFRGVATVVATLFHLVAPDVAVFGEKDAQQLAVVRQMVHDLHFDLEIASHPTVREADGLAMSSRNAYLSADERRAAPRIYAALQRAEETILSGERDADTVRRALHSALASEPLFDVQYAEVVDAESFQPVERITGMVVVPVAVELGATRLIDNVRVDTDG